MSSDVWKPDIAKFRHDLILYLGYPVIAAERSKSN